VPTSPTSPLCAFACPSPRMLVLCCLHVHTHIKSKQAMREAWLGIGSTAGKLPLCNGKLLQLATASSFLCSSVLFQSSSSNCAHSRDEADAAGARQAACRCLSDQISHQKAVTSTFSTSSLLSSSFFPRELRRGCFLLGPGGALGTLPPPLPAPLHTHAHHHHHHQRHHRRSTSVASSIGHKNWRTLTDGQGRVAQRLGKVMRGWVGRNTEAVLGRARRTGTMTRQGIGVTLGSSNALRVSLVNSVSLENGFWSSSSLNFLTPYLRWL